MSAKLAVLAVLAAAVTLTSVGAAAPVAAKQRVAITAKVLPTGAAVLDPLQKGALERDSGTFDEGSSSRGTEIRRFTGKRGNLVFRERLEWVEVGSDLNRDGFADLVALGTWKVARGTGPYAGITGGGRSAHLGLGRRWVARYEGFLTVP
jgi:hypothetical protein